MRCAICAGEQPALTPRKLTLMNTTIQSVIQDISFQTSILAVRLNRKRCCSLQCMSGLGLDTLSESHILTEDDGQRLGEISTDQQRLP